MNVGTRQISGEYRSLSRLVCSKKATNHPETEHHAGYESLISVPHIWPSPSKLRLSPSGTKVRWLLSQRATLVDHCWYRSAELVNFKG
jgi:hypothetical protein